MVNAKVMVTAPKPPASMQLISPPAAVFEIAPANVSHGALRLHGLPSLPRPETQVRVAWALADNDNSVRKNAQISVDTAERFISPSYHVCRLHLTTCNLPPQKPTPLTPKYRAARDRDFQEVAPFRRIQSATAVSNVS